MGALGADGGWRPAPGEWSANECVGHLIEAERRGFAGRVRAILAADRPDIPADLEAWDPPDGRRGAARPRTASAADLVARVRRAAGGRRRRSSAACAPEDLARVGMHPDVGPLRVDEVIAEWVHHDRNHIRQLLEVTQSRVWAQMGNARRFSLEDL